VRAMSYIVIQSLAEVLLIKLIPSAWRLNFECCTYKSN
jgi:hypothetical protein